MGISLFTGNPTQMIGDDKSPITFDHPSVEALRKNHQVDVLNSEAHEKRLAAMTPAQLQGEHGEYQSVLNGTHAQFKTT